MLSADSSVRCAGKQTLRLTSNEQQTEAGHTGTDCLVEWAHSPESLRTASSSCKIGTQLHFSPHEEKYLPSCRASHCHKMNGGACAIVNETPSHLTELPRMAGRLRVERKAPFIIKYVDNTWLQSLGFSNEAEIIGRALRICYGPFTSKNDLAVAIRNCVGTRYHVTVYRKDGEPKEMMLRAFAVDGLDGSRECLLEMHEVSNSQPTSIGNDCPKLIIDASAPHCIKQANVAFLSAFQCTLQELGAKGLGVVLNTQEQRQLHKLLRAGRTGRSQACQISTPAADKASTVAAVAPIFGKTEFAKAKRVESLSVTIFDAPCLIQGLRRVDGRLPAGFTPSLSQEEESSDSETSSSAGSDGEDESRPKENAQSPPTNHAVQPFQGGKKLGALRSIDCLKRICSDDMHMAAPCLLF